MYFNNVNNKYYLKFSYLFYYIFNFYKYNKIINPKNVKNKFNLL